MTGTNPSRRLWATPCVVLAVMLAVWTVHAVDASAATPALPAAEVPVGFNNNAVPEGQVSATRSADLLQAAGVDIDRVGVNWHQIEPSPGEYRWEIYDAIYAADLERGIRPLFILAYAPKWARAPNGPCGDVIWSCHEPPAPEHYDDYARTAAELAERYPDAAGIEIWNEPNVAYFWRPEPDPVGYADLLAQSYEAIKASSPTMKVVTGGTASGYGSAARRKISGWDFLGAIYLEGAKEFMDVISLHAYPSPTDPTPATALVNIEYARLVRDWFDDGGTPIWVTETGISTSGFTAVTERAQASLLRTLESGLRSVDAVEMVLVHTLVEANRWLTDPELGYGVVTRALRRKPAYCQLALGWGRDPCGVG